MGRAGDTQGAELRDPGQKGGEPVGPGEGGSVVSRCADDVMSAYPADSRPALSGLLWPASQGLGYVLELPRKLRRTSPASLLKPSVARSLTPCRTC